MVVTASVGRPKISEHGGPAVGGVGRTIMAGYCVSTSIIEHEWCGTCDDQQPGDL